MVKKYVAVTIYEILLVFVSLSFVFAQGFNTTIGFKSYYTTGISDSNIAYKPYGKLSYDASLLYAELTGNYIFNQQITDGLGNFTTVNVGQGTIKGLLKFDTILELGGGYSIARGDQSYKSNIYTLTGSLNISAITLDIDYTSEHKEYTYNSDITLSNNSFMSSLSIEMTDNLDLEFDYNYFSNEFSNLDYTYYKHILRTGLSLFNDTTMYMAGVDGGKDSGDYAIIGVDVGISTRVYDACKIMILYNLEYYNAPTVQSTSGGGHGGNNTGYKRMNPYMRSSLVGKSFYGQTLAGSVSFVF